jgi:hypothetical protein
LIVAKGGTDENSALTYVAINFKQASGGIYAVRGVNLDIRAYWKDNSTIVIEPKKDYVVSTKCK